LFGTQQGKRRRALLSSYPRPGIISKDDRTTVPNRAYPYSAVVRIAYKKDRSTVAQCTGSFVSGKVLLTSAACVYNNDPDVRAFYDLDLITLYDSSKRRLNATVASVIVDDLYMLDVLSSDVALIVLESPIDLAGQYGVLNLSKKCSSAPANANRPSLLGYPRTCLRPCV
jgi:V8-like Glu-specific endopeptidase